MSADKLVWKVQDMKAQPKVPGLAARNENTMQRVGGEMCAYWTAAWKVCNIKYARKNYFILLVRDC